MSPWTGVGGWDRRTHTLLNAVLIGTTRSLGIGDALDALIKVVLGRGALLRLLAFCPRENTPALAYGHPGICDDGVTVA